MMTDGWVRSRCRSRTGAVQHGHAAEAKSHFLQLHSGVYFRRATACCRAARSRRGRSRTLDRTLEIGMDRPAGNFSGWQARTCSGTIYAWRTPRGRKAHAGKSRHYQRPDCTEAVMLMGLAPPHRPPSCPRSGLRYLPEGSRNGQAALDLAGGKRTRISQHLNRAELGKLVDPANYLGLSGEMVDRVLAGRKRMARARATGMVCSG